MEREKHNLRSGFVLLPGGGMGEWVWTFLTPLLTYQALCIDGRIDHDHTKNLKQITINDCVQFVVNTVNSSPLEKVILVAHSGSGCLLELIAGRMEEKVKSLIFISANIPPRGKRTIDALPFFLKWMNLLYITLAPGGFKLSSKQREKMIRKYFCNCCSEEMIEFALKHPEKTEPPAVAMERIYRPELKNIPKIFIKLSKDKTGSLAFQERMIRNLGRAEEYLIESDHMVMLSRPQELAGILNKQGDRFFGV